MTLTSILRQRLRDTGDMRFVDFMQQALYAPEHGYYSARLQGFGESGDFVTAPELSPLFGYSLANQCQQLLSVLHQPILFEFGAGSGRLCIDVLTQLERLNALPQAYWILEVSPALRQEQQRLIKTALPHLFERVEWLMHWPDKPFTGVVIANEVLDAMPVHRFLQTEEGLLEEYVTLNHHDALSACFKPCADERLLAHVTRVLTKEHFPYHSEANLFIDGWLLQCYTMLHQGALILIDYGFPRHEYYHPDRHMGTLMCHHRHHAHTNPLIHIGEQDITAHVEFTHVAEAGDEAGFHVAGYTNQASFLLSCGLLNLLDNHLARSPSLEVQQAVKALLQPSEMGELFKVLALTKHIDIPLLGFQQFDKRVSL